MAVYKVQIEQRALADIQNAIDYYNSKQKGLGVRFYKEISLAIKSLKKNPLLQIRYDEVRCLPLKNFPFMIHFVVKEDVIQIYAVISTYLDPGKSWLFTPEE